MKVGAGACANVGLCGCLGPHPQSVPAVESGVRPQAGMGFLPCACLIPLLPGLSSWRGQMLLLMRIQGLGPQPELSYFIRGPENRWGQREQHCLEWLPDRSSGRQQSGVPARGPDCSLASGPWGQHALLGPGSMPSQWNHEAGDPGDSQGSVSNSLLPGLSFPI